MPKPAPPSEDRPPSRGFAHFARATSRWTGRPSAFLIAFAVIVVWGVTGPIFHFSDTWQLVINTGTTVITFLMVFLIQNSQNRDSEAIQVKLDELIRAIEGAKNTMIDLEELDQEELERIHAEYTELAAKAHREIGRLRGTTHEEGEKVEERREMRDERREKPA